MSTKCVLLRYKLKPGVSQQFRKLLKDVIEECIKPLKIAGLYWEVGLSPLIRSGREARLSGLTHRPVITN